MDYKRLRDVPLDTASGTQIGLYKFLEAVRECPSGGKTAWHSAVEQNGRRNTPLPLPDLVVGKVPNNKQNTKLFSPSDVGAVLKFTLNEEAQKSVFESEEGMRELSDLVRRAHGDPDAVQKAASKFHEEDAERMRGVSAVCPVLPDGKLYIVKVGGTLYAPIIMYMRQVLKLNGDDEWTNWLEKDFRRWQSANDDACKEWTNSSELRSHHTLRVTLAGSTKPSLLIYHKPDGWNLPTPFTTCEGLSYIVRRCQGRSRVSDALAAEAFDTLSRFRVGDARMHKELDDNAQTATPIEKAFVMGIKEAAKQETAAITYPPDVIATAAELNKAPAFVANSLSAEERAAIIDRVKKAAFKKISAYEEEADAQLAEAKARKLRALSDSETIVREAALKKEQDERQAALKKEEDERQAALKKEEDERQVAHNRSKARDESRLHAQSTRESLAKSRAEELAALERCRAICPDFDRKRSAPSSTGEPAAQRLRVQIPLRGKARQNLIKSPVPESLADNPDLAAYRAAGIPDDALPSTEAEATEWRTLAAKEKLKAAEKRLNWTPACGRLRPSLKCPTALGADMRRYPSHFWYPAARAVAK